MSDYQSKDKLGRFSYAIGLVLASNVMQSGIEQIDMEQFMAGFSDNFVGKTPETSMEEANLIIQEFMLETDEEESLRNFEESVLYLANNIKNEGVIETASGLQYKILKDGNGEKPGKDDLIKCHYHGVLLDGRVFESTIEKKQPSVFPVNAVVEGWMEALLMMKAGSQWRLFIPPDLAYGEQGAGGLIGPNATLIVDVELLEIV